MKKVIFSISMLALIAMGCTKEEILGPDFEEASTSEFKVTNNLARSGNNINFGNGQTVTFTAKLENKKAWTLTIAGQNSSAVRTFSGVGSDISVTWTGDANGVPIFQANEVVDVVLSFPANPGEEMSTTVSVLGVNGFENEVIVTDFAVVKAWPSDFHPSVNTNTTYSFPDGNNYFHMSGAPWQGFPPNEFSGNPPYSPYIDFVQITPALSDVDYGTTFPLYANADRVYFNMIVGNTGADAHIVVTFQEQGGTSRTLDVYAKGEVGSWRWLSIPYSQTVSGTNATPRPNKIVQIDFVLLSDESQDKLNTQSPVSFAFDHVSFTNGAPISPIED